MVLKVLSNPNPIPVPMSSLYPQRFPCCVTPGAVVDVTCHLSQFLCSFSTQICALGLSLCLGWDLYLATVLLLVAMGLYTTAGGLLSICWPLVFLFH